MAELLLVGLCTLIVSYMGVSRLQNWAGQRLLVLPNERSSHTQPTASGGGIVIVLCTLLGLVMLSLFVTPFSSTFWLYMAGATLLAIVGWYDDLHTIPHQIRLGAHGVAAFLFLFGMGTLGPVELPFFGTLALGWLGLGVSFLWLVGLTNAYNFMDGIDGLAGSQAAIAGTLWVVLGYRLDAPLIMALGTLITTASLGFLAHNWSPARIFMGDVGSTFLGYSFGILALVGAQYHPRLALVGLLVLWPFVFDTAFTLIRRWYRGENIFHSHRSHLYQRLVIAGYSHRTVTFLYAYFSLIGATVGLLWLYDHPLGGLGCVIGIPILSILLWSVVQISEARMSEPLYPSLPRPKLILDE